MPAQQRLWIRRAPWLILCVATTVMCPSRAFAQNEHQSSWLADLAKHVVIDPTTYGPAIVGYDATMRDWNSSQPFFRNGFVERNPRFTSSGLPNDVAVSYGDGKRRILADALATLEISAINNVSDRLIERLLIERHPNHRKLFRALGWAERVSFAAYLSYQLSAAHYRQWQSNEQTLGRLGLK